VGTTNRTHLPDYVNAIDAETALIFRAHRSNFDIVGFTTEPSLEELVELAHNHDLLFVDDLGSGALIDTRPFGLKPEPLVQTSIQAGADVVMFSGDKLLGGPQAGILVGCATTIARLKKHPLTRAIRPDKLCLAALTATLLHYVRGEALQQIPVWKMIGMPLGAIEKRAIQWRDELSDLFDGLQILDGQSVVGGGSLPGEMLPTKVLAIPVDSPEAAARHLREQTPPVIVRKEDGWITVDPRTVPDRDNDDLLRILRTLNR
nr:L-seryl-tRNA(Sec) selenium transferase [Anaerolineae bacterium]